MARAAVGIYISANSVDIVELEGSPNAPQILNFTRERIPDMSSLEAEQDEQKRKELFQKGIASILKAGLGRLKITAEDAYTVLPSGDVMIRYFSMPQLPRSEQAQAVKFESRKYIPFKLDEIVSDFKIIPSYKGKKTVNVLFIASARERLNFHLGVFKKAEINATGVDIVPFALIRVLMLERKISAKDNAAVLYVDETKGMATVIVVDKGMPCLSRDFKISADDKESLFEKIASELSVSLDYYHRGIPSGDVTKVIICGERLFTDLERFIADELKIITETAYQLRVTRGAENAPASSLIAIGTALGQLGRSPYAVNLSPIAVIKKKRRVVGGLLVESAIAAAIIIASLIYGNIKTGKTGGLLNFLKNEAKALPEYTAALNIEELKELKENKLKEIDFLRLLLNERLSWAEKMDRVANDMPEGIWIDTLTAREGLILKAGGGYPDNIGREINISGNSFMADSTKELEHITKFFTRLKGDAAFMRYLDDVNLGSIDKKDISGCWITSFKIFANSSQKLAAERKARWSKR